jgi:hypothetical protein
MSLRKELSLTWQGKEHKLLVTMEVIDRIEDQINVGQLLAQQTRGDIRFSHVAKFLSVLLNESGAQTTQESVYTGMFQGGDITPENMLSFMANVYSAFFPEPKKKESVTAKKTTSKRKPKATRGSKSTS